MNNKNDNFLNFQNEDILIQIKENIISSRESRKTSKEQVSKLLNINLNLITHLENGNLKEIEYNVFNLGHIRSYLKWLNIDSKIFFDNVEKNQTKITTTKNKNNIFNKINIFIKFKFSNLLITILCLITSVSIIIIWKNFSNKNILTKNTNNYINDSNHKIENNTDLDINVEQVITNKNEKKKEKIIIRKKEVIDEKKDFDSSELSTEENLYIETSLIEGKINKGETLISKLLAVGEKYININKALTSLEKHMDPNIIGAGSSIIIALGNNHEPIRGFYIAKNKDKGFLVQLNNQNNFIVEKHTEKEAKIILAKMVKSNLIKRKKIVDTNFNQVIINNDKQVITKNIKLIKIIALDDSWIEIQNNKTKTILSKIIKKDEEIELSYEKGLKLVTGNAGGIIIVINNKTIKNIGKNGEVKRDISLDYENLIKLLN